MVINMKKSRSAGILLIVVCSLFNLLMLASCFKKEEPAEPITLSAPTVALNGEVASWDADPSADKFEISINGELSYIENTVTERRLSPGETFKIRAVGDGTNYKSSEWSNSVTYTAPSVSNEKYTVTFLDHDGSEIFKTEVEHGGEAALPGAPERDGYRFDGWDKETVNITENTVVNAKYIKQVTVRFVDHDNSILSIQTIDINGDAAAPEIPERSGYRFTGWNKSCESVKNDITVKAEYIKQYKIRFLDPDGSLIEEVNVDAGANAKAPNAPLREGYEFVGWDGNFTNVGSNASVKAKYELKKYAVRFVMPDGRLIKEERVEHGFTATAPAHPEVFAVGEDSALKVYKFTRWDTSFANITSEKTVTAVYESKYENPVIIAKLAGSRAELYLYVDASLVLNAIEFSFNYSTKIGNIAIDQVNVNSASPLWSEDSEGNNNNQYVVNNNEKSFSFAWSDAGGKSFDWCSKVITLDFAVDGGSVDEESFVFSSCSAVISYQGSDEIVKATPVILYK